MTSYTARDIRDLWAAHGHMMTQDRLRVPLPLRACAPVTSAEPELPSDAHAGYVEFWVERRGPVARVIGIIPGSDVGAVPVTQWESSVARICFAPSEPIRSMEFNTPDLTRSVTTMLDEDMI